MLEERVHGCESPEIVDGTLGQENAPISGHAI
jgi:hypothetical protein